MPLLKNARHESLAGYLAQGQTQQDAGVNAGYSERSAASQVCNLLKERANGIYDRVEELRNRGSERIVERVAIDKAWVLEKLIGIAEACIASKQYSPANKSLELVGKEMGMFQDVIPREIFSLMMAAMGAAVAELVSDAAVLEQIIQRWERISVAEPRQLRAGVLPGPGSSAVE